MELKSWMSAFQDRKLGDMRLPGSHDAGTAKDHIDKTFFGTNSNAATQSLTIAEQLQAGTRFFDLRLATHKKQVVAHHTTGGQGAFSQIPVDDVLASAAEFCRNNRTEVAIFRISHTSLSTDAHKIAIKSGGNALHTGTGNLCDKTLGEIVSQGGGLVCIFDVVKFGAVIDQSKGVHGYAKYSSQTQCGNGISTCGCYSGTHKLHQVMTNGLKGQYDHNMNHTQNGTHLWQVYWQKTYVNPMSTTGIQDGTNNQKAVWNKNNKKVHGGTHASTAYMLKLMKGMAPDHIKADYVVEKEESKKVGFFRKKVVTKPAVMYSTLPVRTFSLPNIISYDFVNSSVNSQIIRLNETGLQALPADDS
jgi:hypothetical protein